MKDNEGMLVEAGTTYIYGLCDPRDGRVRYVGKADDPTGRLKGHLREKRHCHRVHWIQSLLKEGLKPTLTIIQKVAKEEWEFWERLWISMYDATGHDLVNSTSGGNGAPDPSPETRERMGTGSRGRKQTPEERAKRSASMIGKQNRLGKRNTLESNAKRSVALKGRKQSTEHASKRAVAMIGNKNTLGKKNALGHKQSPEHIAKRAASRLETMKRHKSGNS